MISLVASIPSPSTNTIDLFGRPVIHIYGLCIATAMFVGVWWSAKRFVGRGGDVNIVYELAAWGLPAGIIGARLYHVATDWHLYSGNYIDIIKVWDGGLGIWGGVALGFIVPFVVAYVKRYPIVVLADCAAPAIPLAQAIGRLGNYFNQEVFGRPTDLPWGLQIDVINRPENYEKFATFHPTFLYEILWNLLVVGLVLVVQRRQLLKPGSLMALYVMAYCVGRYFIEQIRIDEATIIAGQRVNEWTSIVIFALAGLWLGWWQRREPKSWQVTVLPAADKVEPANTGA